MTTVTLPPPTISAVVHPHRGVDQSKPPNHQHVGLSVVLVQVIGTSSIYCKSVTTLVDSSAKMSMFALELTSFQ
jgi:hypothetical protein